jgi:hypothetical protein
VSTSSPPCATNASRTMRRCTERTSGQRSLNSCTSRVEPSMSVNTNVTVPPRCSGMGELRAETHANVNNSGRAFGR